MSIVIKELTGKVDALITAVDTLSDLMAFGNRDVKNLVIDPFRAALDEVERMKFQYITRQANIQRPHRSDLSDAATVGQVEEFIRKYGQRILDHQAAAGMTIRPDDAKPYRYRIFLGELDPLHEAERQQHHAQPDPGPGLQLRLPPPRRRMADDRTDSLSCRWRSSTAGCGGV